MASEEKHRAAIEWTSRGAAFAQQNRIREAADCFRQAVDADPAFGLAQKNLGLCLETLGDLRGAATAFGHLLEADASSVDVHKKLGDLHVMLKNLEAAAGYYQSAIALDPGDARVHQNLGSALGTLGRYAEAVEHFRRCVELRPDVADCYRALGLALTKLIAYDEAEKYIRQAVNLEPSNARAHANLGLALMSAGRIDEALTHYERSLELNPNDPEPRFERALCLFLKGNFEAGWAGYESRMDLGYLRVRHNAPMWDGSPLQGRILLIETEQGVGDTIQFVRYAAEIKKRHSGRIILACEPHLVPLLTGVAGVDLLLPQNAPRPPFDCWISLLSLPKIFGHGLSSFPAETPYLAAQPDRVAHWKAQLASVKGRKIGIAWQGSKSYAQDQVRSIPLANFLRLEDLPDVTLISLQKGAGTEQLATGNRVLTLEDNFDEAGGAFLDTAAVMMNLDLVISADTSVAHLAGALGVPVWLALPFVPHWRWTMQGERTPWYPSMRLFRQSRPGDWADVFERIAEHLFRAD